MRSIPHKAVLALLLLVLLPLQGAQGGNGPELPAFPVVGIVGMKAAEACRNGDCDGCVDSGCRHLSPSASPLLVAAPAGSISFPSAAPLHGRLRSGALPASPVSSIDRPPWG